MRPPGRPPARRRGIVFGSGRRSLVACRVSRRRSRPACPRWLPSRGFGRVAECRLSPRPRSWGGTCRSQSGRKSRSRSRSTEAVAACLAWLQSRFAARILAIDGATADGRLNAPTDRKTFDSLIAATARVDQLTAVRRSYATHGLTSKTATPICSTPSPTKPHPHRRDPDDDAAKESNLPSRGLPGPASFEDWMGHQARAAPRPILLSGRPSGRLEPEAVLECALDARVERVQPVQRERLDRAEPATGRRCGPVMTQHAVEQREPTLVVQGLRPRRHRSARRARGAPIGAPPRSARSRRRR